MTCHKGDPISCRQGKGAWLGADVMWCPLSLAQFSSAVSIPSILLPLLSQSRNLLSVMSSIRTAMPLVLHISQSDAKLAVEGGFTEGGSAGSDWLSESYSICGVSRAQGHEIRGEHKCACTHTHKQTHTHTCTHICKHIHTHTYAKKHIHTDTIRY